MIPNLFSEFSKPGRFVHILEESPSLNNKILTTFIGAKSQLLSSQGPFFCVFQALLLHFIFRFHNAA